MNSHSPIEAADPFGPFDARWSRVLRSTSRSFYLSLRFVPARRRTALSLGYLIARAGDTVSDAGRLDLAERSEGLQRLRRALRGAAYERLPLPHDLDDAHRELLAGTPDLIARLERLPPSMRDPTHRVLRHLLRGMHHELDELARAGAVVRATAYETQCWAFRAAGCVGRYWCELLELDSPAAARREQRERARSAMRLGLGLQKVNLLRDLHEDFHRGRVLLAGLSPKGDAPEAEQGWIRSARADLLEGFRYAAGLRGVTRRDRFAIVLPARLGWATLDLLAAERERWRQGERMKIGRSRVRAELIASILDAWIPRRLRRWLQP